MQPIIRRTWAFPTDAQLRGKEGSSTFKGVKQLRDTLADHVEKVGTALTEYHLVDTLVNRPQAGKFGRHFYATDTHILYEDIATAWVPIGGPGFPFYTLLAVTADAILASSINYFVTSTSSTADINVNLPTSTGGGIIITVKKMDASGFNTNLVPAGADTIDTLPGAAIMTRQYEALNLIDFGAGSWLVW